MYGCAQEHEEMESCSRYARRGEFRRLELKKLTKRSISGSPINIISLYLPLELI